MSVEVAQVLIDDLRSNMVSTCPPSCGRLSVEITRLVTKRSKGFNGVEEGG